VPSAPEISSTFDIDRSDIRGGYVEIHVASENLRESFLLFLSCFNICISNLFENTLIPFK
jgi:hypothetical protein